MEMTGEQKLFLMENIIENISDGVYCVDLEKKIFYWNKGAEQITGYSSAEMLGKNCEKTDFRHMEHTIRCDIICPIAETASNGKSQLEAVYIRCSDGTTIEVVVNTMPLMIDGNLAGAVEIFTQKSIVDLYGPADKLNINELKDKATGLPDKEYINYYIESKIQEKRRFDNPFIVTFLQINNLDEIISKNDKTIGDEILKALGEQIKKRSRQSDLIGRWDKKTIVGVFASAGKEDELMLKRELYNQCMKLNVTYSNRNINMGISVGSTVGKTDDILPKIIRRVEKSLREDQIR